MIPEPERTRLTVDDDDLLQHVLNSLRLEGFAPSLERLRADLQELCQEREHEPPGQRREAI